MNLETQDQPPNVGLSLDEVGISDFRTQISITRGTKIYRYTTNISVVINLPPSKKGAHMSRFIESISEILSSKTDSFYSLEEMSIQVLHELNTRHPFETGMITLSFEFFTPRLTPVSKRKSMENYQGRLITRWKKGSAIHKLSLATSGSTACPHALANNPLERTHIQRAYAELTLKGTTSEIPDMEIISKILDQSFSAPSFSLLKQEDEHWIVNRMYENPLFVEDVTRNLLINAAQEFRELKLDIDAITTSLESIHKHNVISKGSISTYSESKTNEGTKI
ncbi:MAG: GTP cyclohydrolase, FolE2/MptA family [Candidatus Hodarchaeales archaeon]|jgi:GTP cyclohydrolase-4